MDLLSATSEYIQRVDGSKGDAEEIQKQILETGDLMVDYLPLRLCR